MPRLAPTTTSGQDLWSAVGALTGFGVLSGLVARRWRPLAKLDGRLSTVAYRYGTAHPKWVTGWRVVTGGGGPAPLTVLAVGAVTVLARRRRWSDAGLVLASAAGTQVLAMLVRRPIARHRPPGGFVQPDSWAFPSGHTVHSATAAVLAAYVITGDLQHRARGLALAGLTTAAVSVGASRVVLVAHWPTDVVGGWLLVLGTVPVLRWLAHQAPGREGTGR